MASAFIGYTVLVTLVSPQGAQLQGVVRNVVEQKLILEHGKSHSLNIRSSLTVAVTLLWSGQYFLTYVLEHFEIADLEVDPQQDGLQTGITTQETRDTQAANDRGGQELREVESNIPQQQNLTTNKPFVDPAILSFPKPPPESVCNCNLD